ncbi:solute carrier family 22 member 6-like [Hippopotamus amphibius kiboko]|uniref:solute carrier family 22 member 6-like n=1 Tax=Hippopotamus amphibius kiboko TaxID=575201 RepID=UPI0025919698|nr:solute carrier family 22 member 6-like [Hippopotamus amphibius kiboko]
MAFNDLLVQVGGIGRYQQIQTILLVLPLLLIFLHNILQNFTAAIPTHHCRPPADTNLSKDGELEAWLPRDGQGQPESCLRFTSPQRGPRFPNGTETNHTGATEPCTHGWIYDNSTFPSTIVTEWDLVCAHKTLPQLSQSIIMAGIVVGNLMFGTMADRLGRLKVLIWSYLQLAASGTCVAFAPNFPTYCACRFLSGMAVSGASSTSIILSLEWLPIHARPGLGFLIGFVTTIGQFFLAGMAYAVPHWRHLQLLVSLPFFVILIYFRFFTESALWHSSLGNLDLALKALQRVAQINGQQKEGAKLSVELLQMSLQSSRTISQAQPSMLQLLRSPAVRQLFLCIMPLWFVHLFSLYGLIMSLQSFEINIYLTQVLFTIPDLPFYFLGFLATKSLGRRHTQMGSLLLSGILILTCAMIPPDQIFLHVAMAALGKGCLCGSLNCLSMYAGELYATVMRQRGLSMTTTVANIGSILSPLVGMTSELYPSLPFFIYGGVLVAACPIIVLLPETLGLPLPNTLQDLERRWKERSGQKQQEQQMVPLQSS